MSNKKNEYRNKKELSIDVEEAEADSDGSIEYGQTLYIEEKPKDLEEYLSQSREHALNFNSILEHSGLSSEIVIMPKQIRAKDL